MSQKMIRLPVAGAVILRTPVAPLLTVLPEVAARRIVLDIRPSPPRATPIIAHPLTRTDARLTSLPRPMTLVYRHTQAGVTPRRTITTLVGRRIPTDPLRAHQTIRLHSSVTCAPRHTPLPPPTGARTHSHLLRWSGLASRRRSRLYRNLRRRTGRAGCAWGSGIDAAIISRRVCMSYMRRQAAHTLRSSGNIPVRVRDMPTNTVPLFHGRVIGLSYLRRSQIVDALQLSPMIV